MPEPITFSLDVEDHRPEVDPFPVRYPDLTRRILDHLDERGIVGTMFVVGTVAEEAPDLVRDIAARGHEVGLHAWRHVPLTTLDEATVREETARGKALLEDLTGAAVAGFRAPTFSITAENVWVTEVLAELGFTYSSSVLPAPNPLFGFPGLPTEPFTWPSGLVELPCPLLGVGKAKVPFIGGVYLRALPWPVIRAGLALQGGGAVPFTYCHPYDFDPDEPYWVVPEAGPRMSRLLWIGRKRMFRRIDALLDRGQTAGPPLRDRLGAATPVGAQPLPASVGATGGAS